MNPPMTMQTNILELPLQLVGIPEQITDWLQQAGFPVVQLGQHLSLKSGFSQRPRQHASASTSQTRCLLFDSRDVWSRSIAKRRQKHSLCRLDIAKWFLPIKHNQWNQGLADDLSNTVRIAFLEQFKNALETAGGVWARIADLPFPYQSVGCLTGNPSHADLPNQPQRLDVIQQRYLAGLPSVISAQDLAGLAALPPVSGLQSQGLPLLWRANQEQFADWWQQRNQLKLKLWQSPTHFRIDCPQEHLGYCPVLEIWRGQHLASIPLRAESVVVRKDGLVFQQQPKRHPAGFTAGWPNQNSGSPGIRLLA